MQRKGILEYNYTIGNYSHGNSSIFRRLPLTELTPKQKRFIDEYLVDFNATKAAIRAGYSAKTARQIGQQNLSKLDIREAIKSQFDEIHDMQKKKLIQAADKAINALIETVENGRGLARVNASNSILDRAGHKPIDHIKADISNQNAIDEIPIDKQKEAIFDGAESFGAIISRPSGSK